MSYGGVGFVSSMKNGLPSNFAPAMPNVNVPSLGVRTYYSDGTPSHAGGPEKKPAPIAAPAAATPAIDWAKLFGGGNQQAASPMQINSSIGARPIYNQGQVNGALSKYSSMAPQQTAGPFAGTAQNLYAQESGRARINTDRSMTVANADHLLRSEMARAQSGIGWGRLGLAQNQLADSQSINQQQQGLALLRAIGAV